MVIGLNQFTCALDIVSLIHSSICCGRYWSINNGPLTAERLLKSGSLNTTPLCIQMFVYI